MRIRSLILWCVAIAFAVVSLRIVVFEVRIQHEERLDRFQLELGRVARDAASLLVLTQDYLLNASPRASRQWREVQGELVATLQGMEGQAEQFNDDVGTLLRIAGTLPDLFGAIEETTTDPDPSRMQPRLEMLSNNMIAETRRISDSAFDLEEQVSEVRRQGEAVQRRITLANQAIFLALVCALAYVVVHRVLRPMARLQRTAAAVESGDLTARSGYRSSDEFGELSRTFDAMTGTLQERDAAQKASNARLSASEASLAAARHDLQKILDATPSMIGYWDQRLTCRFANRAFEDWFGTPREVMPGMHMHELLGAERFQESLAQAEAALRGEEQSFERTFPGMTGSGNRHALVRYLPDVQRGEVVGFYTLVVDVTEQKKAQAQLQSLNVALEARTRQAEQASEAKSQFLANMSHEIRTPIHAVIGLSYLLGRTDLDPAQADLLGKIRVSSDALLAAINDVLDLSKIEAGELEFESRPFRLGALIDEVSSIARVQADSRGIALGVQLAAGLPDVVEGDPLRLNQMLTNLLSNAIKFTERGRVDLAVCRTGEGGNPGQVALRFEVRDTGIGVPADKRVSIFAPFSQADSSTTRRFGGTGLGLSIVSRLVRLMGGTVGLESTPGGGSIFHVELSLAVSDPSQLPAASPAPPSGSHELRGLRILAVDDSELNLEVVRRMLEIEGAHVDVARNGQEALDVLRELPTAYDTVLMDVQMPVLDGHEATRRIRGELGLATLPVIALTAGALTSERQRAAAAGMDGFISKPFDACTAVACILSHLRNPPPVEMPVVGVPATIACDGAGDWPEIDGIDTADAQCRMGDDVALFRRMLLRWLRDPGNIDLPSGPLDGAAFAQCAMHMHRLKGSSGTLGANGIHALAAEAEALCGREDGALLPAVMARLAVAIGQLRAAAESRLRAPDEWPAAGAGAHGSPGGAAAPEDDFHPESALRLVALLRQQDMAAIQCFEGLSAALRRRLDPADHLRLSGQIARLEFKDAAALLDARFRGAQAQRRSSSREGLPNLV